MAQATSHAPATARPPRVCTLVPFIVWVMIFTTQVPLPCPDPEMKEEDIAQVTEFLHQGIQLAQQAKADHQAAVKAAASTDRAPSKPTTKVWAM